MPTVEHMFITDEALLRARTSRKWTEHPPDVLPMHIAEMNVELEPHIRAELEALIEAGDVGYTLAYDRAAAVYSGFAKRRYGWRIEREHVTYAVDVCAAIVEALRFVISPGDAVVLTSPVYPPFFELIAEAGGGVVDVPLLRGESAWRLDLAGIERALLAGARAVLLCNPHNPVGAAWPADDLRELAAVAERHGAAVVSDEIHGPLAHPGEEFTPFLTVSAEARECGIALTSGSKAFSIAGLKSAMIISQGSRTAEWFRRYGPEAPSRVSHLGMAAMSAGFESGDAWLDLVREAIAANHTSLRRHLAELAPGAAVIPAKAGYLAWVDVAALGLGEAPAARILERARVAFNEGSTFGATTGRGFVRINLACDERSIRRAAEAIAMTARDSAGD